MREIVFDTETTGFDPTNGDRVVEIGCVEMIDGLPTDKTYHQYINPERDMPEGAFKIHGLSTEFLKGHPVFPDVVEAFLEFVGDDAKLVAHNAEFDMRFINWELQNAGYDPLSMDRVVDTLQIARTKFPGSPNSLDALCKRFNIENGHRTLHGALLDSEILADVYIELMGGRQQGMDLGADAKSVYVPTGPKKERPKRTFAISAEELAAHDAFLKKINDPLWLSGQDNEQPTD